MPHGIFCWNELNSHDVEGAKRFYGAVMGWTFEAQPIGEGTYWVAKKDGDSVAGIYEMKDPRLAGIPEHWLAYIAVDDTDAVARKVKAEKGAVLREPFDVAGVGRFAIVRDANGAVFAVLKPLELAKVNRK